MNQGGRAPRGELPILHRSLLSSAAAPPADGATPLDRRRLNRRWLCASSLIATCGAALMGAALRMSVDTDLRPAPPTFRKGPAQVAEGQGVAGRRGDRLVRHQLVASDREEFSAPVAHQVGAREIIRTQPFVRLVTSLSSGDEVDGQIPPFDPTRQLAEDGQVAAVSDEPEDDPSGTMVTITRSGLAGAPVPDDAPGLSDEDVTALVETRAQVAREAGSRIAVPFAPQRQLSQILVAAPDDGAAKAAGADAGHDPFHAIEVRVVPENITDLAETEPASGLSLTETRDVVLKRGETLADTLAANGAEPARVKAILAAFSDHARTGLSEGQHVDLLLIRSRAGQSARQISRVTLYGAGGVEEIVAERDSGGFVTVAPPSAQFAAARTGDDGDGSGATLYRSIYEAVLRNGLPGILAERIVGIFAFGLDMQHRVNPSDRLEVLFSPSEKAGGPPEVRYVALTLDGVKHRAYRFEAPEAGAASYFSETGSSLRKFLMRMPIAEGRITSPFGTRVHPILHYARFHNGVDWANKAGTPIMATGDGTVAYAGPRGGYGNRVEIHHANGYVTAYNHLQRLAHGVQAGAAVHQGQVIAYMGSTGLSTGPHVHYEVSVNGHFLDPMAIRLPDSQGVSAKLMTAFERQVAATNTLRHHGALAMSALPL
ncbi:M23 family metallopeptidase [Methylobacterium sp. C1]|uniref:M23 family metallopeptidase n=2 Tax=Methylobacterium TaxID=407 RepID=UPI0009F44E09|nr:M23 family metallopeptidase [Methylobacterium sp. C1]